VATSARLPRDGASLRRTALAYPEAYEEMPWGHHAIKVNGKAFVFFAPDRDLLPFRQVAFVGRGCAHAAICLPDRLWPRSKWLGDTAVRPDGAPAARPPQALGG
jgi:hypothetical protein